jgi:NAD(P)-dependent dehydrogenase (short-subunit alcohol dehydrogenase family)
MDPIAARRTPAGAPVVHGVHTLLWLLDSIAAQNVEVEALATLKVRFRKLVYLGERVESRIVQQGPEGLRAQACVDGVEVLSVAIASGLLLPAAPAAAYAPAAARLAAARELDFQDIEGQSGRLAFATEPTAMARAFPGAARLLGARRLAALGCSTYLVGMVVPGLYSIYVGLDLRLTPDTPGAECLNFSVVAVDERFRRVQLEISGGGLSGRLETFSRLPPVPQASMKSVAELVTPGEFGQTIALVVGGSRGLGELAAKLIAAGGGTVIITYASGKADAERLTAEINDWGGHCDVLAYDVRQDADAQFKSLINPPNQLYYFATPTIARRKSGLCARERFEEFNDFYVHGFLRLVEAGLRRRPEGISAFYPSTVYVQERPADMTEYAMSKAAGEILCAEIARYLPKVRVLSERLPRMATDQTASLIPVESANALSVMLPIVRKMHELL